MIKWHSGNTKKRKGKNMRNYVKEMDFIMENKNPSVNFCLFLSGATFFVLYSAIMLDQKYYQFLLFLIILTLLSMFYADSIFSLPEDENALWNEIQEAREFLEKSSGKAGNAGINALVELYRSGKEDRKWESIDGMLREAFPEKSELRKAVSGIMEGG